LKSPTNTDVGFPSAVLPSESHTVKTEILFGKTIPQILNQKKQDKNTSSPESRVCPHTLERIGFGQRGSFAASVKQ